MKKGFTLIEVLIATAIIVMVGVAAIAIEKNFMSSGTLNKHRLQATSLAEEGISGVKRAFVTNLLDPANPDPMKIVGGPGGSVPESSPGKTYYLDANNVLTLCPDPLFDCAGAGAWQISGNDGITFTRKITFP